MKNLRNVFGGVAYGLLVAGGLLSATVGAAGSPALEPMALSLVGEGVSSPFALYLGPGYRMPGSGVGSSQSASFAVYLGPLRQTYALSPLFSLDTRIPAALAGIIRASGTGAPLAGATVELFLGSTRQQATSTNAAGEYTFYATVFGDYVVRASQAGYSMATSDLFRYAGGQTIQASLNLLPLSARPMPDLALGPTDLTYTVLQNGALTLTAMIHNSGGSGASNVRVRFYDASTGSGINGYKTIPPDMIIASIAPGEAKPVSVTWTPQTAHQRFYVFADPDNAIQESSEINNGADRDLGVLGRVPPHVVAVEAQYDGLPDPRLIGRFLTGIKGAENRFTATVSDADNDVVRVEFNFNGTKVVDTDPSDGWSVPFDTGTLPPGNLPLTVTAYDAAGLVSEPFVTVLVVQDWPWWMKNRLELSADFPISYKAENGYLNFTLRIHNEEYPNQPSLLFFDDIFNSDVLIVGSTKTSFNLAGYLTFSYPVDPQLPWKVEGKAHVDGSVFDQQELGTDVTITASISHDGSVLESIIIAFDQELSIEALPEVTSPPLIVYGVRIEVGLSMDALLALHLSGTLAQNLTSIDMRLSPQVGAQINGVLRVSDPFKFADLELILSPRFTLGPELGYVYPPGQMSLGGSFSAEVGGQLVGGLIWNLVKHTFAEWKWGPWEYSYPRQTRIEAGPKKLGVTMGNVNLPKVFPYPSAASGDLGQVGVTWVGDVDPSEQRVNPEIFFALRDTLGTWGAAERVTTNDRFETTPLLSFLPDGRAVAVWVQSSLLESETRSSMSLSTILDRQDLWYAVRSMTGWSAPAPVIEDAAPPYRADGLPALACLRGGNAMLLWARSEGDSALAPGSGEIFSSVFSNMMWSAPTRMTNDQADDTAPAVCPTGANSALAVWLREEPAGSGNQKLVWSAWDGSTWGTRQTLRDVGWRKQGPSLAATPSGDALATWVEVETLPRSTLRYHLLAARKLHGQQWGATEEIFADSLFIETPVALIDRRNIAVVTWRGYDGQDGDLKVALDDLDKPGSAWTLPRSVTADSLTDWMATAALDGQNNLHVIDLKSNLADTTGALLRSNFFGGLSIVSRGISNDLNMNNGLNFGYRALSADLLLAAGSVSLDRPHPTAGDTVLIRAGVKNIGDVRSVASAVRFYEGEPGSGGVAIGPDRMLPPIAPDSAATASTTWVVDSGTSKLYAVADPAGVVPEQNEGNNMAFVSVGVQPDLIVSRLTVSNPNPTPGDSVSLVVAVRNGGGAAASNFSVRFRRSSRELATVSGLSVVQGDSINVSARFAAAAGLDTLIAMADPDNLLPDPDRTNNRAALVFLCLPDLSVPVDSINYAGTDSSGTLSALIKNDGGVASPSFVVSFYRGNPLVGGALLDSLRVNGLSARGQVRVRVPWLAPMGLSTIYVVADADNKIVERSKGDNESFRDVIRGALPDLTILPGTLGVRHLPDGSINLEASVADIGTANALGVGVEFFQGNPDSGGVLIADRLLLTLDAGQTTAVSVPWAKIDPLDNHVFAIVDRANLIPELRETNNRVSKQFGPVTGIEEQLPAAMALHQAYPNPFNAHTTIRFDLPKGQRISLVIYDVAGRVVRRLISSPVTAGIHSIDWDATDERHHAVASGVYFCRLEANGTFLARKIVLIR